MTSSILSEIQGNKLLSVGARAYFQARLRNRLYDLVVSKFKASGLTKAELARRVGKRPEIVTRLLGAPGNWTLETVSDLLLGICGEELEMISSSPLDRPKRNVQKLDLLSTRNTGEAMLLEVHQLRPNPISPVAQVRVVS